MCTQTRLLRALLAMLLVVLALASALLYVVSLDLAATYPEVAHLRVPLYLAVLVGLVPVVAAVKLMFDFLGLVDHDEAFSLRTVRLLRRLKVVCGVTAVYLVVGLIGVWAALLPLQSPSIVLGWFVAEVVTAFLFSLVALLERLFAAALALRQDNELTV